MQKPEINYNVLMQINHTELDYELGGRLFGVRGNVPLLDYPCWN